jgi:hypothetical protein
MKALKFICKLNLISFMLHTIIILSTTIILVLGCGLKTIVPNYYLNWFYIYLLHFLSLNLWIVAYFKEIIEFFKNVFFL